MNDYENLEEQYEEEFSEPADFEEEEETQEVTKPEPLERKFVLGLKTSRPTVISSGEHVDFVNDVFGIPGDVFTEETSNAVKAYQRGKNLKQTGVVDMTTYRML